MTAETSIPDNPRTLAEKVWDAHVVSKGEDGQPDLVYIDLHIVHEVTSPQAFDGLRLAGRPVRRPDLTDRDGGPQHSDAGHRQADRRPDVAARRSRRCDATRRSSGSGCTPWATPSRASSTSSGPSWA